MDRRTRVQLMAALVDHRFFDLGFVLGAEGQVIERRVHPDDPHELGPDTGSATPLLERVHPEDLPDALRILELAKGEGAVSFSTRVRHPWTDQWLRAEVVAMTEADSDESLLFARLVPLDQPTLASTDEAFSLAAAAPLGLAMSDRDDGILYVNDLFRELTGVGPGPLLGAEASPVVVTEIARILEMTRAGHRASGTVEAGERHLRITAAAVSDGGGEVVLAVDDVTQTVEATAARMRAEREFSVVFEHSPVGIATISLEGELLAVNPALCTITGYPRADLLERTWADISHPDDVVLEQRYIEELMAGERTSFSVEKRYVRPDGSLVWADLRVAAVPGADGGPLHFVAQVIDITRRRAVEDQLREQRAELVHAATHDHLTGLPNRRLLTEHLRQAVAVVARDPERRMAVLFLDLDGFKPVNDRWGHEAGDQVLVRVAKRIRDACRETDVVARNGGDEFVVLCDVLDEIDEAILVANRVIRTLSAPHAVGPGEVVHVGASIGVAPVLAGDDVDDVLRRADAAAYTAKRRGGGVAVMAPVPVPPDDEGTEAGAPPVGSRAVRHN